MPKFDPKKLAKTILAQPELVGEVDENDFSSPYKALKITAGQATGRLPQEVRGFKGGRKKWKGVR